MVEEIGEKKRRKPMKGERRMLVRLPLAFSNMMVREKSRRGGVLFGRFER